LRAPRRGRPHAPPVAFTSSRRSWANDAVTNPVAGALTGTSREEAPVTGVESPDFDAPDEMRTPDKTQVAVVRMGATTAARLTCEPGWRWSECIKPIVGTDSCQVRHVGIVQSGRMAIRHDDGTEVEIGPGKAYVIEPGHD